jgi:hypothetical protein
LFDVFHKEELLLFLLSLPQLKAHVLLLLFEELFWF